MRRISIRQFQQNFHKELRDLPFVVTKRGVDEFRVQKIDVTTNNVTTTNPVKIDTPNVTTNRVIKDKDNDKPVTTFVTTRTCSWVGCNEEAVGQDKVNGRWFCGDHL